MGNVVGYIFRFRLYGYLAGLWCGSRVKALEGEIDRRVYSLYGLTEDGIKIVEGESE